MAKSKYTDKEVFDQIMTIAYTVVPALKGKNVTMNSTMSDDLGLDSLNFVMIICKIEALYGIKFDDKKWEKLSSMSEVVAETQRLIAKK